MEFLNVLFSRIHHYHILNYLIPGCALCFILYYMGINLFKENFFINAIICYLVGLVNCRVSSLIVKPIAKHTHLIKLQKYERYIKAKEIRPFIVTLNENNNMYRSFISVFMISIVAYLIKNNFLINDYITFTLLILLLILFLLSYRKQTSYIVKHIDEVLGEDKEDKHGKTIKNCS